MSTAERYRSEAAELRALAVRSRDPDAVNRWLEMALEYDRLARALDRAPYAATPQQPQPQAMQQQSKTDDEK